MINPLNAFTATLLPLLLTRSGLPFFINWQAGKKLPVLNFEGRKIATAGGAVLFLSLLLCYPFFVFLPLSMEFPWRLLFFYLFGVALLGAIDDLWGEDQCKGLRGHLRKFCRGEGISTGMYKAAGGLLLGLFVSSRATGGNWADWLMGALYLALLSNFFNLLDTRPGRAVKAFLLFSWPIIFYHNFTWLLMPIWGALTVYLPWELDRKIMLGDTGAYLLGGILGFSSLFILPGRAIVISNVILLLLHLFCEKFSLNGIMEKLWMGGRSR